jgi:hypothetical protein
MRRVFAALLFLAACASQKQEAPAADRAEQSRAFFLQASRVFLHPRCANCHPDGETPLQGMDGKAHDPPVVRGKDDHGVVGMRCQSCHQDHNLALARVPGAPEWHVAPREMAWVGKTPRQIMTAAALLAQNPKPRDEDIDRSLAGNLCRCGTYGHIRAAVKRAAGLPEE